MISKEFTYARRALLKGPVFAVTVILTIALGIGASAAIFSVASAVLLRPLPYRSPDRLVLVSGEMRKRSVSDLPFSNADFLDLRQGARSMFDDFAAIKTGLMLVQREEGSAEQIRYASATPNFFSLLGGKIEFGRDFREADGESWAQAKANAQNTESGPADASVAILSYPYWKRRYGGSAAVLGHRIEILGRRIENGAAGGPEIIGVLAPGFELLFPPSSNIERLPEVWFVSRLPYDSSQRGAISLRVVGRLRDGATLESAQTEVDNIAAILRKTFSMWQTSDFHIQLHPMHEHLVAEVKPSILALMGAALFLLLISCANVANLVLVRMSARERELAVRSALGASRKDLIRYVLVEAALLSASGTVLGLGLAGLGIYLLPSLAPASLPRLEAVTIQPAVVAFTALLGLAAAAIFGAVPALLASRPNIMSLLRASGHSSVSRGGGQLRHCLVIAEIALSFILLMGAGLMFRSFIALKSVDPGFESNGLLTFQLLWPQPSIPEQRQAFVRQIRNHLRGITGVTNVTAASPFPLTDPFFPIRWGTEQALSDSSKFQAVDYQVVLPGYFETLHTPLLAGRTFTDADDVPTRKVAVIDEALARKAFPHESAVGKRILIRIRTPQPEWVEVIGVVAHQRNTSLATVGREQLYFTDGFLGYGSATRWAVRTSTGPTKYESVVRAHVAQIGKQLVLSEMQPMDTLVEHAQANTRFAFVLIGIFAFIAALLAGLGIYGVLSTAVSQRTAEIAVRVALGATRENIFGLVLKRGLMLGSAGILIGFGASFGLRHFIASILVGIQANDPATFGAMTVIFLLIVAVASWLPARRAADLEPVVALGLK